jgi:hypothetical protein
MDPEVPRTLRRLESLLRQVPRGVDDAPLDRCFDRLERDLLPRTAAPDAALVIGIVGPNNAGKSALFNALVGRTISPSLPTGGATRRLVGAAPRSLAEALVGHEGWSRFHLQPWDPERDDPERPTRSDGAPAELLLATADGLPDRVLLIDTPDFDSVLTENRAASDALLSVVDVALVVVTRHTYQNAALVEYLSSWLDHGRPWILFYNESPGSQVASEHAAKLASDLGHPPLAVFEAPVNLAVMAGEAPLMPQLLGSSPRTSLAEHLTAMEESGELKRRALHASLEQLRGDLADLAAALERRAEAASEVHGHALRAAEALGSRVAAEAMPAGPFLNAFRTVLDRRTNRFSRGWRRGMGTLAVGIGSLPRMLGIGRGAVAVVDSRGGLERVEAPALERAWPQFFEDLARDLGPEGRSTARAECPPSLRAQLDADLMRPVADGAQLAARAVSDQPVELENFEQICEELVERAIEERGSDLDIQALADLATLLPVALAGVLIVKTGGFAADLGVAGGSVAAAFLLDKYKHVLGSSVTREARRRWERMRGGALGRIAYECALPSAGGPLARAASEDGELAVALVDLARQLGPGSSSPAADARELEPGGLGIETDRRSGVDGR